VRKEAGDGTQRRNHGLGSLADLAAASPLSHVRESRASVAAAWRIAPRVPLASVSR
jgi:hypothetical protein